MADINLNIALTVQEAAASVKKLADQANTSLDTISKQSKETSKAINSIAGSASIVGNAIGTALGNLATGAIQSALGSVKSLFNALTVDGIKAYQEQEDAIAGLNSALSAQGDLTKESTELLLAQAAALEKTTRFSDEAVIGVQALLANITDLNVKGISEATKATLNFATSMRIDVDTAARTIGKAIEGNTVGLSKYGVAVKKGATDSEQFANVLAALNVAFKDSAEQASKTFSGSLDKLKNSFNGLQEGFGSLVAQNPILISGISQLAITFFGLTEIFEKNKGTLNSLIGTLVIFSGQVLLGVVKALQFVDTTLTAAAQAYDYFAAGVVKALGFITGQESTFRVAVDEEYAKAQETRLNDLYNRQKIFEEITALGEKSLANVQAVANSEAAIAETKFQTEQEQLRIKTEADKVAKEQAAILNAEAAEKEIQEIMKKNEVIAAMNTAQSERLITENNRRIDEIQAKHKLGVDKQEKIDADQEAKDRARLNKKLDGTRQFFSGIATLSRTGNKELFEIAKAASLANAIVGGAQAVVNAYKDVPFPFNIAAAAGIAIATGVEIAAISAQQLATGITSVPAGFPNDSFPALLSSNERVLSVDQNKDLTTFLEQGGGGQDSGLLASIDAKLSAALNRPIVVTIAGREIFRTVDDELRGGRVFST